MSTVRETNEIIKQTLSEIPSAEFASYERTKRTEEVRNRICKAGDKQGYFAYGSGHRGPEGYCRGEWLYDIIWLDYHDNDLLRDVKLVLECEWSQDKYKSELGRTRSEIKDDFEKLLLARADLRCMIFKDESKQEAKAKIGELIDEVESFSKSEVKDNYLFCAWLEGEDRFLFCDYTHEA